MRVHVLSGDFSPWHKSIFFPLRVFRRQLREQSLRVRIFYAAGEEALACDVLIVSSSHFRSWKNTLRRDERNQEELFAFLARARRRAGRVVWFDVSDPAGTCDAPVIDHVDEFWKKQLFRDRQRYALADAGALRPWIGNAPLEEMRFAYQPCRADQLPKMRVAWNIGFLDRRHLPGRLEALSHVLPRYRRRPWIPWRRKTIDLHFRGRIPDNPVGDQRRLFVSRLKAMAAAPGWQTCGGGIVPARRYRRELNASRMVLSPFGWGEVCHRDFEAWSSSALLLKPDMSHLTTFPELYADGATCLALRWDGGDLLERIDQCRQHPRRAEEIAAAGHAAYAEHLLAPQRFVDHFSGLLRPRL